MPDLGIGDGEEFWLKDKEVIKQFKMKGLKIPPQRQNLYPPYGPVAKRWADKPEWNNKIGWRWAHALYEVNFVYRQKFEGGMIVGVVRHVPTPEENQSGRIFILFGKDGEWTRWDSVPHDKNEMPPYLTPRDN